MTNCETENWSGMDHVEFANLMLGLASCFRVELDEPGLTGYELALSDLPIGAIRGAVVKASRECKFMPTGAELRRLAGIESPESRALQAWSVVKGTVATCGAYVSVDFDDPVTNATIRTLGGWIAICDVPSGDEFDKWLRKEFERVYRELWSSGVTEELARPHVGLSDIDNNANGFVGEVKSPARICVGLAPDNTRLNIGGKRNGFISKLAGALSFSEATETEEMQ